MNCQLTTDITNVLGHVLNTLESTYLIESWGEKVIVKMIGLNMLIVFPTQKDWLVVIAKLHAVIAVSIDKYMIVSYQISFSFRQEHLIDIKSPVVSISFYLFY